MPVMPLAEYAPDSPDLSPYTSVMSNVVARTPESYGPIQSLASYSTNSLDGQCLGAVCVQDVDLSIKILAGTVDELYMMTAAATTWASVGGSTYTTAAGDSWNFALFNRTIIATNFTNPMQSYVMGTSTTFGNLASAAPQARHICTPKTFAMVGNTYDSVGGYAPGRIWWSVAGDCTSWPTPGSSAAQQGMSDYNDFPGEQGAVEGLVASLLNADVAIFFRHAIWRGVFTGPPDVFDFFPADTARGTPAPNSIVPLGGLAYFLGDDGFYAFDGATSTPIGTNKVDKTFYASVNRAAMQSVIGAADIANKTIVWIYPTGAATIPNAALIYRWDIQRWSPMTVTAEWIARFMSFGMSMDSMPSMGYTDVDTLPFSLDDPTWVGGALQMGAVDGNHNLAFFGGPNMAAQMTTQAIQLTPGRRSFVQGARPLTDATTPTVAFSARQNFFDAETFGIESALNVMGDCPQRSDGRYHRGRITIPAGVVWTEASGLDVTAIPGGWR